MNNESQREMIDGVMKKLMRGIKTAAEPINQHNCAHNDTGTISNSGQCRGPGGRRGMVIAAEGGGATTLSMSQHTDDGL